MPSNVSALSAHTIAQFDAEGNAEILRNTLMKLRMASTQESTETRRQTLEQGRAVADRAVQAIENERPSGDIASLMIETGLYLLECARRTVAEFGAPPEMLPDWAQKPDDRLGPAMGSKDTLAGLLMTTRGYAQARRANLDHPQLEALRTFILDTSQQLIVGLGDFKSDAEQFAGLLGIAQVLDDANLFSLAAVTLSKLLRSAKKPDAAETILRKALEWDKMTKEQRDALKGELASALSEQGKFPEAEVIQAELLGD